MRRPRYDAVILDFDGVLVESVDVKTRAFAALYEHYGTDVVRQVVDYHLENGGLSRYQKFRHYHEDILGITLSAAVSAELGARFSCLVEDAVAAGPWVPGAREFLEAHHSTLPLYIASGTPETELRRIVLRRRMKAYFQAVHGSPATKADIIRSIVTAGNYARGRVLMVGDARTDYDGAAAAGVAFVGRVAGSHNPFPGDVTVLADLTNLSDLVCGKQE